MEQPLTPGCLCKARQAARQGGCGAASAPQGGCGCPRGLRPTAASVASCTSGCAGACSHAIPSLTLPQGRTAFPALGYHSCFSSCSKIPVQPPSRMWGAPCQTCNPRTPLWVRVCPHRAPMTAQLARSQRGQPWHRAQTGLLWWHNQLSPVLVMLPCRVFWLLAAAVGSSPAQESAGGR